MNVGRDILGRGASYLWGEFNVERVVLGRVVFGMSWPATVINMVIWT